MKRESHHNHLIVTITKDFQNQSTQRHCNLYKCSSTRASLIAVAKGHRISWWRLLLFTLKISPCLYLSESVYSLEGCMFSLCIQPSFTYLEQWWIMVEKKMREKNRRRPLYAKHLLDLSNKKHVILKTTLYIV